MVNYDDILTHLPPALYTILLFLDKHRDMRVFPFTFFPLLMSIFDRVKSVARLEDRLIPDKRDYKLHVREDNAYAIRSYLP